MTVSFQNVGRIDLQAAMTFGVSAKVTNNPIGFFGTGLKYAIATILRNGGKVVINDGEKSHTFSVKGRTDRNGQDYWSVFMGNTDLRFSVMLGRNWEAWHAFREMYSNVKDEAGYATNRALKPRPNHTTITVSGWDDFDKAFENRSNYFLEDRKPLRVGSHLEVYDGPSHGVYYRGILIHQFPPETTSEFTYNLTASVTLTEDRTMKYPYLINTYVGHCWLTSSEPNLLAEALTASRGTLEAELNYTDVGYDASDVFLDAVMALRKSAMSGLVNKSATDMLDKVRPVTDSTDVVELTAQQEAELEAALRILETRFSDVRTVPLLPVSTLGPGIYGLARKGKMYISLRCFEAGLVQLVGTIFEEYSHITKDFRDESRDFQNYLINLVAQLITEKSCISGSKSG